MNLEQYAKEALARYHERHALADDVQHNAASFYWTGIAYEITVRNLIVATLRTMAEVNQFCEMHNSRIA